MQLAKALGAEVTATAIEDDAPLVKSLGADGVVPSVSAALSPGEPLFDVLLNTFAGPVPVESYGLVRPEGRLVTLAQPLDQSMAERHGIQGIFFVVASDPMSCGTSPTLPSRVNSARSSPGRCHSPTQQRPMSRPPPLGDPERPCW